MSEKSTSELTAELIRRDFELEGIDGPVDEEALLRLLADHVDYLIQHRMEWLLSLMYRMDVAEDKVQAALSPAAALPANEGLARLILERQKQRVLTKQSYKPDDLGEDWEW